MDAVTSEASKAVAVTPEQRYILNVLATESGIGLRTFTTPQRVGYWLCDGTVKGRSYPVDRKDVDALLKLGYLKRSSDSGGNPEITSAGRVAAVAEPPSR
jgi:hypothetical protein